jgi:hypothetical protein
MKLKMILGLVGLVALIAAPASATVRQYDWNSDNIIYTLTEPGGVFFPNGSWEGPKTRLLIDDCGGCPNPTTTGIYTDNKLVRVFLTSSTTGVPGTTATVRVDTQTQSAAAVGTRTGNSISWGAVAVTQVGGHGQYCTEDGPAPGYGSGGCAAALLPVDVWASSIPPVSPVDSGPWNFSDASLSSFAIPSTYRYFDLNPIAAINIYGELTNGSGTAGYALPVLAPLGALALSGSLIFMGARVLRKQS